jgi:hypothetical protein
MGSHLAASADRGAPVLGTASSGAQFVVRVRQPNHHSAISRVTIARRFSEDECYRMAHSVAEFAESCSRIVSTCRTDVHVCFSEIGVDKEP